MEVRWIYLVSHDQSAWSLVHPPPTNQNPPDPSLPPHLPRLGLPLLDTPAALRCVRLGVPEHPLVPDRRGQSVDRGARPGGGRGRSGGAA